MCNKKKQVPYDMGCLRGCIDDMIGESTERNNTEKNLKCSVLEYNTIIKQFLKNALNAFDI